MTLQPAALDRDLNIIIGFWGFFQYQIIDAKLNILPECFTLYLGGKKNIWKKIQTLIAVFMNERTVSIGLRLGWKTNLSIKFYLH